ncbi:hypothetical protein H5410_040982 [Solanum commersonii]|uniref:Uncharacterized protein n=1 Tax=Solanum commersonii TaxID=4109 RepID=A0A9J5XT50_SOLCO|nr:hypothetical protein H5410_040982 [Solanum commersonii]
MQIIFTEARISPKVISKNKKSKIKEDNSSVVPTRVHAKRSVKSQQAFHRVQMLHRHNKFALIALMESFQDTMNIKKHSKTMQYVNFNTNGQIWVLVNHHIQVAVISD